MKFQNIILPVAGLLGALLLPLAAQAQSPYPHPHNLNQRFRDQHARIHQGVVSGELTRREGRNERERLQRVRRQDRRDRVLQGGHLTAAERRHQNRELNGNSRDIYRTKHNDRERDH